MNLKQNTEKVVNYQRNKARKSVRKPRALHCVQECKAQRPPDITCTLTGAVGGGGVFLAGELSRLDTVFEGCLESLSS